MRRKGAFERVTRRTAAVTAASALLWVAGCAEDRQHSLTGQEVGSAVLDFVAKQQDGSRQNYQVPPAGAGDDLAQALLDLADGRTEAASNAAADHGYAVVTLGDGALALAPAVLPDPRGWGLFVARPGGLNIVLEVPHPRTDLDTERIGGELATAIEARYLIVAGASRRADDGAADVASRDDAVFSAVHAALTARGVPALQLHGFASDNLPGVDLIVSPGSARTTSLAIAVADAAKDSGLKVCRAWEQDCGQLEGRKNVQGLASREAGGGFVHLELTRRLRQDGALVDLLAKALRAASD